MPFARKVCDGPVVVWRRVSSEPNGVGVGAAIDERALTDHLDGRLARRKLPRSVVFAERLPRSGAGEVLENQRCAAFGAP
jgi:acyl-CoA synthetase (AMP-forming)/AMP-acid ligase II